jgi:hypothetical protein
MASGDAQRVWFPEMIEALRSEWHHGMSFEATVELRDELDAMLQRIRYERHIRTPVFKCPHCGHVGEGAQPHVSVRAMFLSLLRFGIADAEQIKTLEKRWAKLGDSHLPRCHDAVIDIHKSDKPTRTKPLVRRTLRVSVTRLVCKSATRLHQRGNPG